MLALQHPLVSSIIALQYTRHSVAGVCQDYSADMVSPLGIWLVGFVQNIGCYIA